MSAVGGDPNIRYYHSHWKLAPDEALVITCYPGKVKPDFWNFQLNNYWMESLDYRYYNVHANAHIARDVKNADGSVVIVVSHQDDEKIRAAQSNQRVWLTTAGHDCGTMCFRWVKMGT